MHQFSLIKQLESGIPPKNATSNIDYQTYELVVEGKTKRVNIPTRESNNFEQTVSELTEKIDNRILRKLLREFRGTRN